MARYIDVDAFIKRLKEHIYINARIDGDRTIGKTLATVIDEMNAFPSADVQEVRHGKFISELVKKLDWAGRLQSYYQPNSCSQCHNALRGEENYCPFCGAKMDGKEEENDRNKH